MMWLCERCIDSIFVKQGVTNQQQELLQLVEKVTIDIAQLQRNKEHIESLEKQCQELSGKSNAKRHYL